ncbi:MAG: MerR family DNA-binding transcriptional regulator, partial [Actinomadura rubrobrunea]|nr:MerR family DNA-binding transcriptional regulator [Actinomadura rubrobrunea]
MKQNLQSGGQLRLRPVDLAREHGLSTQAVRNYEEAGILPAAGRTAHGFRMYTPLHASALRAFLALVPGHGHQTAASIMRAVNRGAGGGGVRPPHPHHPHPR